MRAYYNFQHILLRNMVLNYDSDLLSRIIEGKNNFGATQIIDTAIEKAHLSDFVSYKIEFIKVGNLNALKYRFTTSTMPISITDCAYIIILVKEQNYYFTAEYTIGQNQIALCSWDDKAHYNYGSYPNNDDELIITKIEEIIGESCESKAVAINTAVNKPLEEQNKEINKMIIHKTFGLDLGTTNSTPSVFINGASFCPEDGKLKTIPSLVAKKGDKFIVGVAPKNNPHIEKIRSIKRMMGKEEPAVLNGQNYSPEEISAEIVRYCAEILNKQVEKAENVVYDRIVITVPAYFSIAQKDATRKAGELAGLEVLMLLEEPTAAAINYTVKNNVNSGVFMVYDLGGGTFDVSIIEKIENIPVVLATAGNNFLGGDNFDNLLARYFIDVLNNDLGYDIDLDLTKKEDLHKYNALLLAAENVKKNLSQNDTYTISYYDVFKDNSGVDLIIEDFSRAKFEELIRDKIVIDSFNECQKALDAFVASGRQLSEITGVLMVGGSSHIPYVRNAVKEKFVDSGMIKELIIADPDLAVGYGAGIVAATQSMKFEDTENGIVVEINAPYMFDGTMNISGKLIKGQVDTVGLISNEKEVKATVQGDGTFSADIDGVYEKLEYKFYFGNNTVANLTESVEKNNLIAPTPVQNETIRIEIVDLERQETEDYPLVNKGEALPCSASHNFKINEYSREQIILPVKEGYREIYSLIIDVPENTPLGSRVTVNTEIDVLGKVTLKVLLNNKEIKGKVVYAETKDIDDSTLMDIEEKFYDKIENVRGEAKAEFVARQENITRELNEAVANSDKNHYTDALNKYETLVRELPSSISDLTEEDFDELERELKDLASQQDDINISKIEDDAFFGKRALSRKDYKQAEERYQDMLGMKAILNIKSNPKTWMAICLKHIYDLITDAQGILPTLSDYSLRNSISQEIENVTIFLNSLDIKNIEEKTDDEYNDIAERAIQKSRRLMMLLEQTGIKEISDKVKKFQGRVSKD
ncbi:MAG: Hsp70 family protein [Eubacteriales bacterium]|nr:Hsp70 family protein [Eubacteriales bacterium]